MRNGRWVALAAGVLSALIVAARPVLAAPATQTATQSQPARTDLPFELDPSSYPAGIASRQDYDEYLAAKLQEMEARLSNVTDPAGRLTAALELAGFALTQMTESDLTRVWLLRRPAARPQRALRALAIARRALFEADRLRQRSGTPALDRQDAARLSRLRTLLAMETVLLDRSDPADALRAAGKADTFLDEVPTAARPAWDLLVAACLQKAGKRDDALLRVQLVLRQHKGSPSTVAAAVLQSHILADAGSYAAAIALLSEYLQVLPATVHAETNQRAMTGAVAEGGSATRPAGQAAPCALTLLKADFADEWADKLARSTNTLDRQTAASLREQAADWHAQAEALGPYLFRLLPVLRTLDAAGDE